MGFALETRGRNKAPVFVVGCPRSGTTLLYHMLLSSGGFAIYHYETQVFNMLGPKFGDLGVRRNRESLLKYWLTTQFFQRSGLRAQEIEARVLAECKNAGDFLRIVMEEVARNQNVNRWAECTPTHLLYIPIIKKTIPDALVVHVIRDGRDVALSLDRQGWIQPFPWEKRQGLIASGVYWEWIVCHGRNHGRALGSDYLEVHYEQLVDHPRETLAKLSSFIHHDLDYDRIRKVGLGSVSQPNTSFEPEASQVGFNPIGRWKSGFAPDRLVLFEALVGHLLQALGYPLATCGWKASGRWDIRTKRALYHGWFGSKLWLKANMPVARFFVSTELKP